MPREKAKSKPISSKKGLDPMESNKTKSHLIGEEKDINNEKKYCGKDPCRTHIDCVDNSWLGDFVMPKLPDVTLEEPNIIEQPCLAQSQPVDRSPFKHPCVKHWSATNESCGAGHQAYNEETKQEIQVAVRVEGENEDNLMSGDKGLKMELRDAESQCLPNKDLFRKLYHFTEEDLDMLLEAYYYFARDIAIPIVPANSKTTEEEKTTNSAQTNEEAVVTKKTLDKGNKKLKDKTTKKEGKKMKDAPGGKKGQKQQVESEEQPTQFEYKFGLDRCGLADALRAIGQNPSELDLGLMYRAAGYEPISLTSFLYAVDCWKIDNVVVIEDDLLNAFKVFDYDDTWRINVDDLRYYLTRCGEPLYSEDVEELLALLPEPDMDGKVDLCRLVHALVKARPRRALSRQEPSTLVEDESKETDPQKSIKRNKVRKKQ